ncbi:hypothetical protein D3C81_2196700 [compost metagenome]
MRVDVRLQDGGALRPVRHIELQDARLPAAGLHVGLDGLGLAALLAAMQHQVVAGVGQRQRDRAAYAAA